MLEPDARGRQRAVAWVPLTDGGMNFAVNGLETATTIEDAFGVGSQAGMPAQNLVVGERGGRIGWSVTGRIPRRVGFDGTVPDVLGGRHARVGWMAGAGRVPARRRTLRLAAS